MWPWLWDWSKLDGPTISIVFATLLGPILAVQAQRWIEEYKGRRNRKDHLFRTLMATRRARVAPEHVQALNLIDFEFWGNRGNNKKVLDAWNLYRDHLNTPFNKETQHIWIVRQDELFTDMLFEMSVCLGYGFDKVHINKSVYSPVAHGNLEDEQTTIRRGLVELFSKRFAIPVITFPPPQTPEQIEEANQKANAARERDEEEAREQAELRGALLRQAKGEFTYKVEIVNPVIPDVRQE